jgi:hypothetical protein
VKGTRKQTKQKIQNKLTLSAFKINAILHNTLLATFIKLLETVSKGLFRNRLQNGCHTFLRKQKEDAGAGRPAPADFFLFPRLKSIMKGARFEDVAAIQERVTAVLRSIPKEAFADSFQKLHERCQQCVVKDGDYFEGQ